MKIRIQTHNTTLASGGSLQQRLTLALSLEREALAPAKSPDCLDRRQAQPCLSL